MHAFWGPENPVLGRDTKQPLPLDGAQHRVGDKRLSRFGGIVAESRWSLDLPLGESRTSGQNGVSEAGVKMDSDWGRYRGRGSAGTHLGEKEQGLRWQVRWAGCCC